RRRHEPRRSRISPKRKQNRAGRGAPAAGPRLCRRTGAAERGRPGSGGGGRDGHERRGILARDGTHAGPAGARRTGRSSLRRVHRRSVRPQPLPAAGPSGRLPAHHSRGMAKVGCRQCRVSGTPAGAIGGGARKEGCTMKIITADQRLTEKAGAKILIIGPSGVGKTSVLRTLSPNMLASTLFVDIEAGDIAVSDLPIATVRPRRWEECLDLACVLGGF